MIGVLIRRNVTETCTVERAVRTQVEDDHLQANDNGLGKTQP